MRNHRWEIHQTGIIYWETLPTSLTATQNNIPRNNLVLIDKIRFLVDHEEPSTITSYARPELKDSRDYVNHGGLSRLAIFNQVEDCLKRLQTTYIDILLIHMTDAETPFEETMGALNDLVRSGKVHYIGASNIKTWEFIEMNNIASSHGWATFSCVQMEHSLLYRTEVTTHMAHCGIVNLTLVLRSVNSFHIASTKVLVLWVTRHS